MADNWTIRPGQNASLDFGEISSLQLGIAKGNVTIIGHDEPTTHVEVTRVSGDPGNELRISVGATKLEIDQFKGGRIWNLISRLFGVADIDLTIVLPRNAHLSLGNTSANMVISGMTQKINAATVTGSTTLDSCSGKAEINSVSGEISIIDHDSTDRKVEINTVSGDVTVSGAIKRLELNSVSADLTLDLIGPIKKLEVNQTSGNTILRFDRQPTRYGIHGKNRVIIDGVPQSRFVDSVFDRNTGSEFDAGLSKVEINSAVGKVSIMHRAE